MAEEELPGLPIIGRVRHINIRRSWVKFKEWGNQYQSIYQPTMMDETYVWISSHEMQSNCCLGEALSTLIDLEFHVC